MHFKKIFAHYLEEAEFTLSLIKDEHPTKNTILLEVGAGLGLVYGYLKKCGYTIYGIEPSHSGFDENYQIALELFKTIGISASTYHNLSAVHISNIHEQFDLIFSNNVLEHIPQLEESLAALKNALKENGTMVHNTVNYLIPYDPHFKILLVPFFPKYTTLFKPSLKTSSLWNCLNFITVKKLKTICKKNNLMIHFKKDSLIKALMRLDTDPGFAHQQHYFIPLYRILKVTKLLGIIKKIPISLATPITFTIKKNQ